MLELFLFELLIMPGLGFFMRRKVLNVRTMRLSLKKIEGFMNLIFLEEESIFPASFEYILYPSLAVHLIR